MASAISTLRQSFSPLQHVNFRIYLGGQAISLIGTWLQNAAQAWVVWTLTGSEAALGTVTAFGTLPLLLLGPFAGVWVDRFDRRKLLIVTQAVAMVLAFVLAFLVQSNTVQVWHVYGLSLLLGIVTALDLPAQQTFLGDLAGMDEVRKAINLNAMIINVSRTLGPAVSGILVARIGIAPAFWLNGLSFIAVIASLIAVRARQVQAKASAANPLRQLLDAMLFVRTQPRMQDMFLFALMTTFFVFSVVLTQLPAFASVVLHGDAETAGYLQAASGAGSLMGVLFVVPLAQAQKRSGLVLTTAAVWMGLWMMGFAFSAWLPLSMVTLFFASIGAPTIITLALGLTQLMSPPNMRGRLISLFTMLTFGLQPLSAYLIGQSAEQLGVQNAIQINAVLLIVGALAMLLLRGDLRRWEVVNPQPNVTQGELVH
ncbi:MAG: MFS transporter [Anaerolineae bacterium]